jgi:hypothetical protein
VCVGVADGQLDTCLAADAAGFNCGLHCSGAGCPNPSASRCRTDPDPQVQSLSCCQNLNQQDAQCNSNHDLSVSFCSTNYDDCVNNCGLPELPANAIRRQVRLPRRPVSDVTWALLVRNLSRPGKLTPSSQ